ncbi:MAG: hypothetical protein V1875_09400 [Candidatus Altiarchaeota archaeon]
MKVYYHKEPGRVKPQDRTRTIRIVAVLIAAMVILLVVYAVQNNGPETATYAEFRECTAESCPSAIKTVSLATDRGLYHSRENLKADITIESELDQPADITLHGINAKGYERLNLKTSQELGRGRNIISMGYMLPSCTGCSGISPGNYTISADVKTAKETKTANAVIEIMQ